LHNSTEDFRRLQSEIIGCRKCPRLVAWRERVAVEKVRRYQSEEYWGRPVPAFGDTAADLLVIGLAPAAHGANRTGRMFTGDRSGQWLYEALHRFGFASRPESHHPGDRLRLSGCMVTAALRCAPPANKPTRQEIDTCRPYLRQELQLLLPTRVVVTLGHIAFQSFLKAWRESGRTMAGDGVPKFRHAGEWRLQEGSFLLTSYHPSQQNTQTGRLTRPMFHDVFRRARILIRGRAAAK
jgi:uracil-DNA glycosylase family 4